MWDIFLNYFLDYSIERGIIFVFCFILFKEVYFLKGWVLINIGIFCLKFIFIKEKFNYKGNILVGKIKIKIKI